MSPLDKRKATRVKIKSKAKVSRSGIAIQGDVEDLSLKGIYIKTPAKFDSGSPVEVMLQLGDSQTNLNLPLKGVIVRKDDKGMAVQFDQIELDGIVHLRNIIIYAHQEIDKYFTGEKKINVSDGSDAGV
jgi:hypothetical protein